MSFPTIVPFRLCTASPDEVIAVTMTFPESVISMNVTPPDRFSMAFTSEEPKFPRRYAFLVLASERKRSSNRSDAFFTPEGDAITGKLHVKLVVAA